MASRAYRRHAALAPMEEAKSATGSGTAVLRTDEIPRHAVRLVIIDSDAPSIVPFASVASYLRASDLVVVNDAATLPASLPGKTARGEPFELRLSAPVAGHRLVGVLFDRGDHRTRTEHREPPPPISVGERVAIAGITARVEAIDGRRIELVADVSGDVSGDI
jgi:S-adenosylmethionine:tRNA ribosyltransferase-isomerase